LFKREKPALKLDRKYQNFKELELLSAIGSKYDADLLLIPIFD
jgi:hypothetical protein